MSLAVSTADPSGLLSSIKLAIDQGHIVTWSYDSDGDFTHTPPQWSKKAWLRPSVLYGTLSLTQLTNTAVGQSAEVTGVYHGRFIEMLIAHFKTRFTAATAI